MDEDDLIGEIPAVGERERRALAEAETWVGGDVAGVAIGEAEGGGPCIVVYSTDPVASARQWPPTVEGLPVQLVSTTPFTAESGQAD